MNILILDDHQLFAAGLKELILTDKPDFKIEHCSNSVAARTLIEQYCPQLVLLDLDLGRESGLDLIEELLALNESLKIAILSGSESVSDMKSCIHKGAIGYIKKSLDPDSMLKAVDLICSNGSYFPSNLLPYLLQDNQQASLKQVDLTPLTQRQREVSELLKKGTSNKLIAYNLGISEGTVKLHVSSILEKLNVTNRSEAIVKLSHAS